MPHKNSGTPSNISLLIGAIVGLHCTISSVDQARLFITKSGVNITSVFFQISFICLSDYHIIRTGLRMYSRDHRYSVIHSTSSKVLALKIQGLQPSDQGECQTPTSTGVRTNSYWPQVRQPMLN